MEFVNRMVLPKDLAPYRRLGIEHRDPGVVQVSVDLVAAAANVLLTGSRQDARINAHDILTGESIWRLQGHGIYASLTALAISSDASIVASGDSTGVWKIWDVASRQLIMTKTVAQLMHSTTAPVRQIAITESREEIAVCVGRGIYIWGLDGKLQRSFQTQQELQCFVLTHDDILVAGNTTVVRRLEMAPIVGCNLHGKIQASENRFQWRTSGHSEAILAMAVSSDGLCLATASVDTTAKVWCMATGQLLNTLNGHRAGIRSIAFARGSTWLVTSSDDGRLRVWNRQTGRCVQSVTTGCSHSFLCGDGQWAAIYNKMGGRLGRPWVTSTQATRGAGVKNRRVSDAEDDWNGVHIADLGGLLFERRCNHLFAIHV